MSPPPDFFVIGAYRSGTTALHRLLGQHPEIFVPTVKEPNFYAVVDNPSATPELLRRSVTERSQYEALYRGAGRDQRRGDLSPEYLRNEAAPGAIHREHPEASLIAMLRNPVERAWSDFLMHRRDGTERCDDFAMALAEQPQRIDGHDLRAPYYLDGGLYHQQLQRYLTFFREEQLLVVLYQDFRADRSAVLRSIFRHLGVDEQVEVTSEDGVNASGLPANRTAAAVLRVKSAMRPMLGAGVVERLRPAWDSFLGRSLVKPELLETDRRALVEYYRRDVEQLSGYLGRDLSGWLGTGVDGAG